MAEENQFDNAQFESPQQETPVEDKDSVEKTKPLKDEKGFLKRIKKKNKGFLIDLDLLEKERIAGYIKSRYDDAKESHNTLADKFINSYK